ncbi:MAG: 5-formyltetrahydrofolate cyclo-ligase [Planctomycetota bacterium]
MTHKALLRERMKSVLAAVTPAEAAVWSGVIGATLQRKLDPGKAVLAFWPIGTSEPDLRPLCRWVIDAGTVLALPRCDWTAKTFVPAQVVGLDELVPGRYGMTEPPGTAGVVDQSAIGTVLIPGLAFDAAGRRLGRGAGFYDRFLAQLPRSVQRIGVAFDVQIVDEIPSEAHDVPVELVVTEARTHSTLGAGSG